MTSSSLNTNKKPAFPNLLYQWRGTTVPIQSFGSWNPFSLLLSLHIISVHWTCCQLNPHNHIPSPLFSHVDPVSRTLLWKSLYCGGHFLWCQNIQHPTLNKGISLVAYRCFIPSEQPARFPCKPTLSYFHKPGYELDRKAVCLVTITLWLRLCSTCAHSVYHTIILTVLM
jgi:hypothetical protein